MRLTVKQMKMLNLRHKLSQISKYYIAGFILSIINFQVFAQDFTTITWGTAASQKYPVSEAQGRVVNGKLYTFGGFDSQKSTFTPTKRAYVYNPVTNVWSSIADLPQTPNGSGFGGITHAGITTDSTDIYIAGGYTSNASGTGQIFGTKQVWKYIISQNTYTRLPDLPIDIAAGQLEYLQGKIHYISGTNSSRTADLGNHYVLDLKNLSAGWKTLASLPNPRQHAGSAVYGGKIYYIGGQHGQDTKLTTQKEVDVYNPQTNSWTRLADLPVPAGANGRGHISSATVLMGDRIIVLGGEIVHQSSINMVSAFSPATNSWTNLTPLPKDRFSGVAAVLTGDIFYTGGSKTNTTFKGIPGTSSTSALLPAADAFVRNGNFASINYGNDATLNVKSSAVSNYTRLSYLKFSLNSVSNITSAKLRIYGSNIDNSTAINLSAYGVNNDNWTETTITYNNAPGASTGALSSTGVNNQAKYYELDVTDYVKNQFDKVVSLLIKNTSNQNSNLVFNSRENSANKPQLVISSSGQGVSSFQNKSIVSANSPSLSNEKSSYQDIISKKPIAYPNPLKTNLNIKLPASYEGNFNFEIYNEAGINYNLGTSRIVHGSSTISFDLSKISLRPGVYFLKIKSETVSDQIKLIKL